MIAGKVAEAYGWRAAFHVIGLPGIVLALVVLLTVREPSRGAADSGRPVNPQRDGLKDAIRKLLTDRSFMLVILSATTLASAQAIAAGWGSAFLMRLYHVSQGDVGIIAGPVIGLGGILGTVLGGTVASWLTKRLGTLRSALLVPIATTMLAPVALLFFCFGPTLNVVLVGGGLAAFLIAAHTGPVIAVGIGLVGANSRSMASSIFVVGQSLIGFGIGPTLVGFLSDFLSVPFGMDALRYAMLAAPLFVLVGWFSLLMAFRSIGSLPIETPIAASAVN